MRVTVVGLQCLAYPEFQNVYPFVLPRVKVILEIETEAPGVVAFSDEDADVLARLPSGAEPSPGTMVMLSARYGRRLIRAILRSTA